jgi:hypothetical protein
VKELKLMQTVRITKELRQISTAEFRLNVNPYPGEVDPADPRRGLDSYPAPHVIDLQPTGAIDGLD